MCDCEPMPRTRKFEFQAGFEGRKITLLRLTSPRSQAKPLHGYETSTKHILHSVVSSYLSAGKMHNQDPNFNSIL